MFDLTELERAHAIVGQAVPATPARAWPLLAQRLGTEVVVISPRPGRILERVKVGFSRITAERDDIRAIKASPDFIAMRERILGHIWQSAG